MSLELSLLTAVSLSSALVIALFVSLVLVYLFTDPYPNVSRTASEEKYYDPIDQTYKSFPNLREASSIDLSVIVPAYNEEERLRGMMNEMMEYLRGAGVTYEVIIVDDGSTDRTSEVGLEYSLEFGTENVRVLTLARNRGKGGAVRHGMRSSRGRELLFADADGATDFKGLASLRQELGVLISRSDCNLAVACGSRAHLHTHIAGDSLTIKRSPIRTALMHVFRLWVNLLCAPRVIDTQCGFKLFSRPAARLLFGNLHVDRWAFDVELLYLARHFRVPVAEVPVSWTEQDGSKLVPVFSWLQMARDILLIRVRYAIGAWKIEPSHRLID